MDSEPYSDFREERTAVMKPKRLNGDIADSPVSASMTRLSDDIMRLQENVGALQRRLQPILNVTSMAKDKRAETSPNGSMIVMGLQEYSARVRMILDNISEINEGLEL